MSSRKSIDQDSILESAAKSLTSAFNTSVHPSSMTLPGFTLIPEVISPREENSVLTSIAELDLQSWDRMRVRGQVTKRMSISFGWSYSFYSKSVVPAPKLPAFLKAIRKVCSGRASARAEHFDQAVLLKYPPNSGMGPHLDARCFGPVVLILSLKAACYLSLSQERRRPIRVILPPRSLAVLKEEARYDWKHQITGIRSERLSIIFRSANARG